MSDMDPAWASAEIVKSVLTRFLEGGGIVTKIAVIRAVWPDNFPFPELFPQYPAMFGIGGKSDVLVICVRIAALRRCWPVVPEAAHTIFIFQVSCGAIRPGMNTGHTFTATGGGKDVGYRRLVVQEKTVVKHVSALA